MTGGDARPTLWRGRPRPRLEFGHFGTGVLARQIAESGLEIGQTPERLGEAL